MPALTDSAVRAASYTGRPTKIRDGAGLYIHVLPTGKFWRFDYRVGGKRKTLAIGAYPSVTLKSARIALHAARAELARGADPGYQKQLQRHVGDDRTFAAACAEWLRVQDWSDGHRRTVELRLKKDVLPRLGHMDVGRMGPQDVLYVLRGIEARGAVETAHRAKVVIGQIMRYAVGVGLAPADPTRDLRGVLRVSRHKPHPAIVDPARFGTLLRAIDAYDQSTIVLLALRLAPYVALRPGELRMGRWAEIDLDGALWIIGEERMKARKRHVVPLAEQAVEIIRELQRYTGRGELMFPSLRAPGRPISAGTLNAALRYLGFPGEVHTPHGFRSSFSTMANEGGHDRELIEIQLAHIDRDRVRALYNRGERIEDRRTLMQWWADEIDVMRSRG